MYCQKKLRLTFSIQHIVYYILQHCKLHSNSCLNLYSISPWELKRNWVLLSVLPHVGIYPQCGDFETHLGIKFLKWGLKFKVDFWYFEKKFSFSKIFYLKFQKCGDFFLKPWGFLKKVGIMWGFLRGKIGGDKWGFLATEMGIFSQNLVATLVAAFINNIIITYSGAVENFLGTRHKKKYSNKGCFRKLMEITG